MERLGEATDYTEAITNGGREHNDVSSRVEEFVFGGEHGWRRHVESGNAPELDDVGLASALETYAHEWGSRYGIATEVTAIPSADRVSFDAVPRDVAGTLYRVAQEGLTNIAKHARATQVSIVVDQRHSELRLIMEDNGQGFDVDEARTRARHERRLGLGGMEERAALLGGRLVIESTPESGTTLYVRLPLAR